MNDEKELTVSNGTIRKIIAAAVCDLSTYISSSKEPFITGGQYSNKLFLDRIRSWCLNRKLDLTHPDRAEEVWLSLCDRGLLSNGKKFECPPKPIRPPLSPPTPRPPTPPPKPPKPPSGAKYGDGDQDEPPAGGLDGGGADDWKDKKDRKTDWRDEGEDWKKEGDDDKT